MVVRPSRPCTNSWTESDNLIISTMVREFRRYRRRLPHFRLDRASYSVTWCVHPSLEELPDASRKITFDSLMHFNNARYDLLACVVMNDHVHLVLRPYEDWKVEKLVHGWKSFSAHAINKLLGREGHVWQEEYHDRIVRDEDELIEKLEYIFNNPRERWPEIREYPYLWIKGLN
jgi:putative transposase